MFLVLSFTILFNFNLISFNNFFDLFVSASILLGYFSKITKYKALPLSTSNIFLFRSVLSSRQSRVFINENGNTVVVIHIYLKQ